MSPETIQIGTRNDASAVTSADYQARFGEGLHRLLDLDTWLPGNLVHEYARIEREVGEAVRHESEWQRRIRAEVFPLLCNPAHAVKGGGVFDANLEVLREIHQGLLFGGGVEACDGTVAVHDTLPLTVYQIGVSLVSYRGNEGTWHQRLYRRDLRERGGDPVEEVAELLRQRSQRGAINRATPQDTMGEMAQRVIMSYAERAVLLRQSQAVWRVGHGNPVPYELLTGGGCLELMVAATKILRELIERHQKFVFVASEPRERLLLTIGHALRPYQYAIVATLDERLRDWLHQDRFTSGVVGDLDWDGERVKARQWIPRFIERVASQVVIGLFRASPWAPAQVFYAHADHAEYAAHVALADSVLQAHRGFPLLIDLAHHVCAAVFGGTLEALTESAYAAAGVPWMYRTERSSRQH